MGTMTELVGKAIWIAQTPDSTGLTAPVGTVFALSSPQFFIALISGVLLAFAFQLVLTNFSVAAGISYLGRSSDPHEGHDESEHSGKAVQKISSRVGIWTLITVTLALFFACFLAVQLTLLTTARLGAIVGLVIWAAYFSILVWVSSTTVGSLIGSVVGAATSGFQALLGTATAAIGSKVAKQQVVSTAEAVAAAVKHEIGSGIDPHSIRESVESYIQRIRLPGFDLSKIQADFEQLLNDPEIEALAGSDRLKNVDRQTFVDLISRRSDFTPAEVNRFADLLEGVWRQTLGRQQKTDHLSELVDYLKSAQPGQIKTEELNAKLDRILAERSTMQKSSNSGLQPALQTGVNTLLGLLVGRTDLSDLNIEQILNRLKAVPTEVTEQTDRLAHQLHGIQSSVHNPIRTDVENYLLNTYSWQMNRQAIAKDFRNVLYDMDADPGAVVEQLSVMNRSYFEDTLRSRGVFTQDKIQEIVNELEVVRLEVLSEAEAAKEREVALNLRQQIENYLKQTSQEELYTDGSLPAFQALLEDEEASYETLSSRLSVYNRETLQKILLQRSDITPHEAETILSALETTRDRVLFAAQSLNQQIQQRFTDTQQKLEAYLKNSPFAQSRMSKDT